MSAAAVVFVTCGRFLIGAFTPDPDVIRAGVSLLAIGAVFQLCDGLQGVATGILRGLGDTRTPMIWNLTGHWLIGLPLGYVLCFRRRSRRQRLVVGTLARFDHLWNRAAPDVAAARARIADAAAPESEQEVINIDSCRVPAL